MNSTRRQPVQPVTTHPQHCLNPACHAHNAHPISRPQVIPPQPQVAPATPRRQFKLTKNWVIGILIFVLVGMAGTLNDRDQQIAGLKAKISTGQTTKIATPTEKLDYATRICKITHSSATYAQCVISIVGH